MWGSSPLNLNAQPRTPTIHTAHTRISNAHTRIVVSAAVRTGKDRSECCSGVARWSNPTEIRVPHCLARLWLGGKRSRGYLPDFATLNFQSTHHGARPGPTLALSCTSGSPACPAAESARKDQRPEQKSSVFRKQNKTNIYTVVYRPSSTLSLTGDGVLLQYIYHTWYHKMCYTLYPYYVPYVILGIICPTTAGIRAGLSAPMAERGHRNGGEGTSSSIPVCLSGDR